MPDTPETTQRRASFAPADRFEPECEIGLIALATDHAIEDEVRRFLPADGRAPLYTTRVPLPDSFDLESLRAMQKYLAEAATRLMPGSKLDVIAYGCTSATAAIGEENVFAEIRKTRPGIACTTPMTAADAALRRLGANRIVLVTPYEEPVHDAVLRAMQKYLAEAATRLMPGSKLDVIAYGCTSATAAIGEENVFAEIRKTRPGIACTTPMTAADAALRRLGANKIVLVTPYEEPVHDAVVRAIEARGFTVTDRSFFGIGSDLGITQVPMSRIAETVRASKRDGADAVFIACTALRVAGLIGPLERELGLPIIASNHAVAWHALDLCGRKHRTGEGRLFAM